MKFNDLAACHNFSRLYFLNFFIERYENHNQSLKLEEKLRLHIKDKITRKVQIREGSWIDWQHLHRAVTLLTKCRYTLKYTYPFAYYLENGPRKALASFNGLLVFIKIKKSTQCVALIFSVICLHRNKSFFFSTCEMFTKKF